MADQNVTRRYFVDSEWFLDDDGREVILQREVTRLQYQKLKDRRRTACQAPISTEKRCVMYMVNGKERRTPWFYREEIAQRALKVMQTKYGERNCLIYVD